MKFFLSLSVLAVTLLIVGCGKSGPEVYHVTGTVTYQGKPLPTGTVMFISDVKNTRPSSALIDSNGHYELDATAGSYAVQVEMIARLRGQGQQDANDPNAPKILEVDWLIPEKYADCGSSGLTAVVKEGESNIIDLPLK